MAESSGSGLSTTFTAYKVPLSAVLKWPPGNFSHPERRRWLIPYSLTLCVLATLVVGARLWTRLNKRAGGFGWDDSLIVGSWLTAGGVTALSIYGVQIAGLDRHVWDLRPQECAKAGLVAWATEVLFLSSLCLTKVSVLLFFRRLIDRSHSPWINWSIWGAIVFTIAYFFAFFFFLVFACDPIYAAWRSLNITWTDKYTCANRNVVDPLNGVFSVFSDLYSMMIPIIIVSRLTMATNRKVVLYGVFCCGMIVLGAGIARTVWLARLYTDSRRDLTWVGYDLLVWGTLEMQMAIICASAPAMKGFFSGLAETVSARYGSSRTRTQTNNHYALSSKDHYALSSRDNPLRTGSEGFDGSGTGNLLRREDQQPFEDKWVDETWSTGKTSHEMLTVPGKRARVQDGGILITETFSVERGSDPYSKERRVLGI